jgi:hypothetical protein
VLSIVAAGAGGLVAKASGIMPEIAIAGEPSGLTGATTTEGGLVIEAFDQAALSHAIGDARSNREARVLWETLEADGMRAQPGLAYGSRAQIKTNPQLRGHFVALPFTDGRGRSAKLYHALEAQGRLKSFVARWDDADQRTVDVLDVRAGAARRRSRVLVGSDESTIDFADGSRKVVRTGGRGRPPGLAAPVADCGVGGVMCAISCGLVVELSCVYESTVVCGGLALICPPCGAFCAVVTVVMCSVVTSYSCYYVCGPCG